MSTQRELEEALGLHRDNVVKLQKRIADVLTQSKSNNQEVLAALSHLLQMTLCMCRTRTTALEMERELHEILERNIKNFYEKRSVSTHNVH